MFRSPEQALGFAFRIRDKSVLASSFALNDRVQESTKSSGLNQFDLHAQSSFIFNFISRRPEIEQAYAYYLYGTERERSESCARLAKELRNKFGKYKLSEEDLRAAMSAKNVRKVSQATGLTNYKSWKFRRHFAECLDPVRESLLEALWEHLNSSQQNK